MTRYSYHPLILCVLGLSIIGFAYRLYTDPLSLLGQVLFMAAIVAIAYFLYKRFAAKQLGTHYRSHSPQAQKRMAYKTTQNNVTQMKKREPKKVSRPLAKKRSDITLTVIEGKKNKKKNRAHF